MYYQLHYFITGPRCKELGASMRKFSVPYSFLQTTDDSTIWGIALDVDEIHPQFHRIISILPPATSEDEKALDVEEYVLITYHPVYSEEELLAAKLLSVRSSFMKVQPVDDLNIYEPKCNVRKNKDGIRVGTHKVQTMQISVRTPINWRRHFFCSLISDEHTLFCSSMARKILEENQVTGIVFQSVLKQSSQLPIEDIYQLCCAKTVPDNSFVGLSFFESHICEDCGMHMLTPTDTRFRFGIRKNSIDEELDWCETPPFIGGNSYVLISQKMYRLLKEHKMDRSLWFDPIDEVDE